MAKYLKQFVTGHNVRFEGSKRNLEAFEKASQSWREINVAHKPNENSIVLVAGAKNNGKSSLLRYLINVYNDTHSSRNCSSQPNDVDSKVESDSETSNDMTMIDSIDSASSGGSSEKEDVYAYFVDFDPGQSEITSPGIISAHIIRATAPKLQSPPYLNVAQHECLMMSSVGGTNMSVNPRMYMANVRYIFNNVLEHRASQAIKRPIFVNTMGHIRNVGLAMLTDLIKICHPTNLVVLNVEADPMRTIYADLSPKAVDNARSNFFYESNQQRKQKTLDYNYDVRSLQFSFLDSSAVANKNRVASQLAYMATIPEAIYKPIMQLSAKWLSFKKVSVYCVSSYPLKEMIVLELLQHSWVQLVKLKHFSIDNPNDPIGEHANEPIQLGENSICKIVEDISENILYGCGIVADIDLDQKLVAVITPVDQATIDEHVDCIVKPLSIQVPHQMMQDI